MEKESLKTKASLFKNKKAPKASLVIFDLPTLIEKMKHNNGREEGNLNSMILLKSFDKQIVLIALHKGTEIKSFQSNDSIAFQIIEGEVMFQTQKKSATLDTGQLLALHENIKYSFTTKEETVLLLTITSGILQST